MSFFKVYSKRIKYNFVRGTGLVLFLFLLFMDMNFRYVKEGNNFFHVYVDGVYCGVLDNPDIVDELYVSARKTVASRRKNLTFIDAWYEIVAEEKIAGVYNEPEEVEAKITEQLETKARTSITKSYTVKVNNTIVNLADISDVKAVLDGAINKYVDPDEAKYDIVITRDENKKINVLCAKVVVRDEEEEVEEPAIKNNYLSGGVQVYLSGVEEEKEEVPEELSFEDYKLGIRDISIVQSIDVIECYLPEDQIDSVDTAIALLADEQDMSVEYVVKAGDTLSGISNELNMPMEEIVALNPNVLASTKSTLHIGDVLMINDPVPELTVSTVKRAYYEQEYQADVIYVPNDDWYTTQTKVLQEPSTGFRKVIFDETYENGELVSKVVVKEEQLVEAVPKIVERGTKIPPTYIKPINGGRLSSSFGSRSEPIKGAGTVHKGVDWAVPTGTSVYASNGGKVIKAGWGSGYGYVVYIQHDDGRQTRYAHLSKVLCKAGDYVKQGDKIALSGNTGQSTGPHLHFEILINGKQVNPIKYLD